MRIVVLSGPPCAGKTTLANLLATPNDLIVDYDDIARMLGSPALWRHPEPWYTQAETETQARITHAHTRRGTGTAWVIRSAPRLQQRATLAARWHATVYLLDPGRSECRHRARRDQRPSGTDRAVGQWYYWYRPWVGDRDPSELDSRWANLTRGVLSVDPKLI